MQACPRVPHRRLAPTQADARRPSPPPGQRGGSNRPAWPLLWSGAVGPVWLMAPIYGDGSHAARVMAPEVAPTQPGGPPPPPPPTLPPLRGRVLRPRVTSSPQLAESPPRYSQRGTKAPPTLRRPLAPHRVNERSPPPRLTGSATGTPGRGRQVSVTAADKDKDSRRSQALIALSRSAPLSARLHTLCTPLHTPPPMCPAPLRHGRR